MPSSEDSLVSGAGQGADGTPVYVDLDATSPTQGAITIDVGTDQKFSSGDTTLQASDSTGDFAVNTDGQDVAVTAQFIADDGSELGTGTMTVNCG